MAGGAGRRCGFAGGALMTPPPCCFVWRVLPSEEKPAGRPMSSPSQSRTLVSEFAAGGLVSQSMPLHAQARGKEFAEDGGVAGVGGEEVGDCRGEAGGRMVVSRSEKIEDHSAGMEEALRRGSSVRGGDVVNFCWV